MRVVVANLKGGVGKTTTAVFLAEAAARRGPTLLVDADPQGSAMRWSDAAAENADDLSAVTVALPTPDLSRRITGIAASYSQVVIDTPPGHLAIVQAAVRSAEVIIIPCQPTLMDLDRMRSMIDLAGELGRPAAVLLTRTRTGTRSLQAAIDALESAELPVLQTTIPQREAISAAYGTKPAPHLVDLFAAVLEEIEG